ncbi:hypothetical protein B0H14DRAFT_3738066 [Mycena olivaceomarginata]|nr:hypothetical protein B0H14DRAFT_3738066 [Mycena olivaceomarginata]
MAEAQITLFDRELRSAPPLEHVAEWPLRFRHHCYELTYLTIAFDASTVPPFDDSSPPPRNASHLRIPEILDLIFAALRIPEPPYLRRETRDNPLVAGIFARTSFQGPALDFLWREQETLVNVRKCLPAHLWEKQLSSRLSAHNSSYPADGFVQ